MREAVGEAREIGEGSSPGKDVDQDRWGVEDEERASLERRREGERERMLVYLEGGVGVGWG